MRRTPRLVAAIVLFALSSFPANALQIGPVASDRIRIDPAKGEAAKVEFVLSEPAEAELLIYDARDVLVRRVSSEGQLPKGRNGLVFDGRGAEGRLLPPEAYRYVVRGRSGSEVVDFDLTDKTGGDAVVTEHVEWDPEAKLIRYVLPERSRVNIRIGIQDGGPLLRTLLNWLPREAGRQEQPWDGMDASGVIDLTAHRKLEIVIHAHSFPTNTIVVGPPQDERSAYLEIEDAERRAVEALRNRPRRSFAVQPIEELRDVVIALRLPGDLPRDADGVPLVSGTIPVEMVVPDPVEQQRLVAERLETAFFVDGIYQFENETGVLPATWTWDPSGTTPGDHYITGNLIGIEGHFGTATVRVRFVPSGGQ